MFSGSNFIHRTLDWFWSVTQAVTHGGVRDIASHLVGGRGWKFQFFKSTWFYDMITYFYLNFNYRLLRPCRQELYYIVVDTNYISGIYQPLYMKKNSLNRNCISKSIKLWWSIPINKLKRRPGKNAKRVFELFTINDSELSFVVTISDFWKELARVFDLENIITPSEIPVKHDEFRTMKNFN